MEIQWRDVDLSWMQKFWKRLTSVNKSVVGMPKDLWQYARMWNFKMTKMKIFFGKLKIIIKINREIKWEAGILVESEVFV